jgi:hypothetical protein
VEQMRERIDMDKLKWIQAYERDFQSVIKDYKFLPGDLVLVRNTVIESSLDKKMKPRYNRPFIIVRETKGGAYIVAEMIPYFARRRIPLPEGIMKLIDLNNQELDEIEAQPEDKSVLKHNYLMDDVRMERND